VARRSLRPLRLLAISGTLLLMAADIDADTVTAMTYNVRVDLAQDGEDRWELRREDLVSLLRFHAPDVIGIQEGLAGQVEYIEAALPGYSYVGVGRDDGESGGEYSAVYYNKARLELLDTGTFWLSETPEVVSQGWDAALPRICTWARFRGRASSRTFRVFNTHFDHVGAEARANSAALLLEKIAEVDREGEPVLLMGDFNAEPGSAPIAALTAQLDDARSGGAPVMLGPEGTFSGFRVDGPVTRRIDYVFLSRGDWDVKEYAVFTDSRNGRYLSDHLPVYVLLAPAGAIPD
jgi:endonuclease/exonuclease/phosphatase family metal-dependent hydrolase